MVMAKREDGSIYVTMQDDPNSKSSQHGGGGGSMDGGRLANVGGGNGSGEHGV
jgi:hypothetical protein